MALAGHRGHGLPAKSPRRRKPKNRGAGDLFRLAARPTIGEGEAPSGRAANSPPYPRGGANLNDDPLPSELRRHGLGERGARTRAADARRTRSKRRANRGLAAHFPFHSALGSQSHRQDRACILAAYPRRHRLRDYSALCRAPCFVFADSGTNGCIFLLLLLALLRFISERSLHSLILLAPRLIALGDSLMPVIATVRRHRRKHRLDRPGCHPRIASDLRVP